MLASVSTFDRAVTTREGSEEPLQRKRVTFRAERPTQPGRGPGEEVGRQHPAPHRRQTPQQQSHLAVTRRGGRAPCLGAPEIRSVLPNPGAGRTKPSSSLSPLTKG